MSKLINFLKYGDTKVPMVEDKLISVSEGLLEDIRHELVSCNGLYAFDKVFDEKANELWVKTTDLVELDFNACIERIDELLK